MKNIFMFDVESNGLYGKGFAVAAIVSDVHGNILADFCLMSEEGKDAVDCQFVIDNVLPGLSTLPVCKTNLELRTRFYEFYMSYKDDCDIYSDCNYPVETNFLATVAKDDLDARQFTMPFPLFDICSYVNIGIDRANRYLQKTGKPIEAHNPLFDCEASLSCLLEALLELDGDGNV